MNEVNESQAINNNSVDEIDAAIETAKKVRRIAVAKETARQEEKTTRARLTAEQKTQRAEEKVALKEAKKIERERLRSERLALKSTSKKPAHMSKVTKAADRLPLLNSVADDIFQDVTTNLSRDQVAALAAHLNHFNRVQATERALSQRVELGMNVRITGGDPRFIGLEGTVSKAQRIRCYVEVENVKKPIYLFTSDVEVIEEELTGATEHVQVAV